MTNPDDSLSTVALVQNPAFGSLLLWQFGIAFQDENLTDNVLLPHCFLILPLALHSETLALISSTNQSSGLTQLTKKLSEKRELLYSLHDRAIQMRELTLESIGTGISARLISINYEEARLRSNASRAPKIPQRLKKQMSGVQKLGKWFARLEPAQVFTLLRVEA
ncbi:three component ABC system middle component [Ponticaulis sp.]|uniref:three component ABC system middle component n=1 Tax=Ponticaulis sp. TaxID=2020902 RepID=UPI000B697151|nr:three component ABC system middle component [Ponticaulis sp.]MAJ09864.1 hypothetical protein [Ponticaulis sp.]RPG18477.1 MAG: hypothetical protein CBC85_001810 [Hyphomonadaceae bacterium TMED125]